MQLGKQIVVIDNGFVHVGDCSSEKGETLKITGCKNIRVWGTSKGIGQLRHGPQKNTVADDCGTVLVPLKRVVFYINVEGGW